MQIIFAILIGIVVGVLSGLVGVGGGVLLVPILVYLYHFSQAKAQGTSLAMLLPPTGLLAFLAYYRNPDASHHPDLKMGLLIAVGVFVGGYLGGQWAQFLSNQMLRRVFAVFLAGVAVKMFFTK